MPKATQTSNSSAPSTRKEPCSNPSSKSRSAYYDDTENISPGSASAPIPKTKFKPKSKPSKFSKSSSDPHIDWRDVELEEKLGEVPCYNNASVEMAGGDSACYKWGYVLLEKLRIYNREEKSKSRLDAK
ncbi:MAG: hypothetical protein LQ343_004245 [Gyalolechia ehrenbergii]|nr:MAG: hypothetical protein LQ343_004245 [Gyalolechia ehrenbergii]